MTQVQKVRVAEAESGQKLVQFLSRRVEGRIPRSALMRWIRTGQVRVDRSRSKPFDRVFAGQEIRIPPYQADSSEPIAPARDANPFVLSTVYEDSRLLVLAKPPGLATQPGSGLNDSVHDRIAARFGSHSWQPSLVHRLDKETSGLLLVAKSYAYLQHLHRLWKKGDVTKVYLAWVPGSGPWKAWSKLTDTLPGPEHKGRRPAKSVKAESWVKIIYEKDGLSLVAVRLITGRKHQIRLQLATRGLPVLGDQKYGDDRSGQGLLLHAYSLRFDGLCFELLPPWKGRFQVPKELVQDLHCECLEEN